MQISCGINNNEKENKNSKVQIFLTSREKSTINEQIDLYENQWKKLKEDKTLVANVKMYNLNTSDEIQDAQYEVLQTTRNYLIRNYGVKGYQIYTEYEYKENLPYSSLDSLTIEIYSEPSNRFVIATSLSKALIRPDCNRAENKACEFFKPVTQEELLKYGLRYPDISDFKERDYNCFTTSEYCNGIYQDGYFNSDNQLDHFLTLFSTEDGLPSYYFVLSKEKNYEFIRVNKYDDTFPWNIYLFDNVKKGTELTNEYIDVEKTFDYDHLPVDGVNVSKHATSHSVYLFWDKKTGDIASFNSGLYY